MSALGTRPTVPARPMPGDPVSGTTPTLPGRTPGRAGTGPAGTGGAGTGRAATWWASLVVALLLLPFLPLVITSLARGYFHPQVVPEDWSLRAWRLILAPGSGTGAALRDSVVVALLVTAVSLGVAVPAGRVLGTVRFRGRRMVELLLLLPVLVPGIAIALGLHVAFLRLGLAGNLPGVVLVHLVPAAPYVVLLSAGVFANADLSLEDQARSLGARPWQVTWFVTRPLVAPGLAVAALFGFLVSWGQYATTLVVGGGQVVTMPILLFASAAGGDVAVTAALALVHAAPALLLLVVTARLLGRGTPTLGGPR